MKKVLSRFLIAAGALVLFAGCENFLDGGELKYKVEEQIHIANASSQRISVDIVNDDCGSIPQQGEKDIKIGVPYQLDFVEGADYQFVKWVALDKEWVSGQKKTSFYYQALEYSDHVVTDGVSFDNAESPSTLVTVTNQSNQIVIVPLCYRRPQVTYYSNYKDMLYPFDYKFLLKFNNKLPLKEDLLVKGSCISKEHKDNNYDVDQKMDFVNKKYISINVKNSTFDDNSEDVTHLYKAEMIDDYTLSFTFYQPYNTIWTNSLWQSAWHKDGNYMDYIQYGEEEKTFALGDYESMIKGYSSQYLEIEVKEDFVDADNVKIANSVKKGFTQSGCSADFDDEAPRLMNAMWYFPEYDQWLYDGLSNLYLMTSPEKGRFDYKWVHNNSSDSKVETMIEYLQDDRGIYKRVKDRVFAYIKFRDSYGKSIPAENSEQVEFVNVNILAPLSTVDEESYETSLRYDGSETFGRLKNYSSSLQQKYSDGKIVFLTNEKTTSSFRPLDVPVMEFEFTEDMKSKTNIEADGGMVIGIDLQNKMKSFAHDPTGGNKNFIDGLYCIEIYGTDYTGNSVIGAYDRIHFTGNIDNLSEEKDISGYNDYVGHVSQMWVIKDTTPPKEDAEHFILPSGWSSKYNYELPAAPEIEDANGVYGSGKKVWRICKILTEEQAANWTVSGTEEQWKLCSDPYNFSDIWGSEIEEFDGSEDSIYYYLKDDLNNISSRFKKASARLDEKAPVIVSWSGTSDNDGVFFRIKISEQIGLKKVYYDVKDGDGNSYDEFKFLFLNDSFYSSTKYHYEDGIYTTDKENHVLTFTVPYAGTENIYFYPKDYEYKGKGTVNLILEDAYGNKTEPIQIYINS